MAEPAAGGPAPVLQAETPQFDYSVGAAPAESTMLQGSAEVSEPASEPMQGVVTKDEFDPDKKPDESTKKCSKPKKLPPLFPAAVPKLGNMPPKGGGKGKSPLKGGASTGGTGSPRLKAGTGTTDSNPPIKGGTSTSPPLKGGTDTHPNPDPHLSPGTPEPDPGSKDPHKGGADKTPEKPPEKKGPVPPGVKPITDKAWQDEKCKMLADLQRHMSGKSDTFKHWLLDSFLQGYAAAGTFDSKYWLHGADKQKFMFESGSLAGRTMTGAEVNYYFQGMIAAAYGKTPDYLEDRIRSWKKERYNQVPSPETLEMAKLGYDRYKQDIEDCRNK